MKNFLILISASAADRPALTAMHGNITKHLDINAKPLWFDPTHVGYFIASALVAHRIWALLLKDLEPRTTANLRDLLVLEIGADYAARDGSKTAAWLNSHGVPQRGA